jgi:N-acetylglutamate synthase-like GNAT family acetyltransferase
MKIQHGNEQSPIVGAVQIDYLADHPELIEPLAQERLAFYRELLPEYTLETHIARLRAHLNRDTVPIAWVAHSEGQVLGTAALREHDLEDRTDLTPWLGGVLVRPEFRRRGIGAALCRAVELKAAELGVNDLYLFTLDKQRWYTMLGWKHFQPCSWRGRPGDIMLKSLIQPE